MALRHVLPLVLLLCVGFAGVVVLVAAVLHRIPAQPMGLIAAVAFPILVGAAVLDIGWVVAFLLDIIGRFHLGAAAIVVLTTFGAASAAAIVRLFFVEPSLSTVLKDRAELKNYLSSRWKWVVLKTITALIAIYGTALLVFGWGPLGDFLSGKVQHALSLIGL